MATDILMPALSPTMTEGTLARWLKHEGDIVKAGDVIAEIETDKATMEVEAVDEGVLGKILVPDGTAGVAVNAPIAVLVQKGESVPATGAGGGAAAAPRPETSSTAATVPAAPAPLPSTAPTIVTNGVAHGERIFASPLARRIAQQTGVDLATIRGSGPNGRIVRADASRALSSLVTRSRTGNIAGRHLASSRFDAVTGQLRFAWDVMRPDITTYPPAGQIYTPGTPNMWTTATGDEALGLVYLPMGNSGADYYSSLRRPQEKAVSSSLVALDVKTGKPRWTFQTVRDDVWDYDLGSQVSLVDFPTANGVVPAIVLPSKTGEIYILDRRTGQPLTPAREIKAPTGGVEPGERATTQPVSSYASLRKPDLKESDMWGMSPIDQMVCRIQFRMAHYQGFFTPPSVDKRWIDYPGYNGGSDWGSVAVDPRRGVIVANYNDMPNYNILLKRGDADKRGIFPLGDPRFKPSAGEDKGAQAGTPYGILVNAGWRMPFTGMLCKQPPYGSIRAIDLASGKTLWDRPFGQARRNGPFGIPSMLPVDIGTPNNGGPAVTAGGLIFVAASTDNLIRAIDIRTGKTVWSDVLPAGGQATPMVYEQNGKEYIVIMAAGHHFMETPAGDYLIAYALPDVR